MRRRFFSKHGDESRPPSWTRPALAQLQVALADLPRDWIVLRSRRLHADAGPPWVKFIAFHPRKGIALLDLDTADPSAGIEPLDEFLARTGFGAFSAGDPPIVAVALGVEDVPAVAARLDEAFAAVAPCGIKNDDWASAVADLVAATPQLMLTRLTLRADVAPAAEAPRPAPRAEEARPPQLTTSDADDDVVGPPPASPRQDAVEHVEGARISTNADMPPAPFEVGAGKFVWIAASACSAALVLGAIGLVYADWRIGQPPAVASVPVAKPSPPSGEVALADAVMTPSDTPEDAAIPPHKPKHRIAQRSRPAWERERQTVSSKATRPTYDAAARRPDNPADIPAHVFNAIGDWFASLR
jgi:hypothetical protein